MKILPRYVRHCHYILSLHKTTICGADSFKVPQCDRNVHQFAIIIHLSACMAQWVRRLATGQVVKGSSPAS